MNEKLKILYIYTSGRLNSVYHKMWFNAFHGKDVDISIVIANHSPEVAEEFFNTYKDFYRVHLTPPHQILVRFPFVNLLVEFGRLRKFIRSVNPEIVHIQGCYYTFLITPLLFMRKRFKVIFNIWGNDYNTLFHTSLTHKLMIRYLIKKSDLVWLMWYEMTEKVRNDFPGYATKIKTITWGVESGLLTAKVSEKAIINVKRRFNLTGSSYKLIYAKGFRGGNNQDKLIEALAQVDPTLDYQVILHCSAAGNDVKYEKVLHDLIVKFNLDQKVIISHDYLSDEEMQALFKIADLSFAISSKDLLTITIFETIISGTNLILSNIDAYKILGQVIQDNFDLVDVSDTKIFAAKIENYIRSHKPPDWQNALKFIKEKYLFDQKTGEYMQIYRDLIKGN